MVHLCYQGGPHLGTEHHQIAISDKTAMEIVPLMPTSYDEL